MCSIKLKEWIVVLGTLLRRSVVYFTYCTIHVILQSSALLNLNCMLSVACPAQRHSDRPNAEPYMTRHHKFRFRDRNPISRSFLHSAFTGVANPRSNIELKVSLEIIVSSSLSPLFFVNRCFSRMLIDAPLLFSETETLFPDPSFIRLLPELRITVLIELKTMLMNLNSPVKMLPQEVETPSVPDSEMSSAMGSVEYKRKAEPDALAAPCAKKIATSDSLPKEDKTPLEDSFDITEGSDSRMDATDKESDITDDEVDLLDPYFTIADKVETIVHYTTEIGDFQAVGVQRSAEAMVDMVYDFPVKMVRVQIAFHKDGKVFSAGVGIREI